MGSLFLLGSDHCWGRDTDPMHLSRLLDNGTEGTKHNLEQIAQAAAANFVIIPDLPPHHNPGHQVDNGDEQRQTAHAAGFSHSFGILPERVARHEVGDDAQGQVVKAAEQAVLELFAGHVVLNRCKSRFNSIIKLISKNQ